MTESFLIGLDYGTESARGILLDVQTGQQIAHYTHKYRHGVMTDRLPDGTALPPAWALQSAPDYTEAAEGILGALGRDRMIAGIGVDFTASSPMPARADGTPLSSLHPNQPHAYVKLWKHQAAQPMADQINWHGGDYLANFRGKLSAEWLLPKAAQLAEEAPNLWDETERFIEAGDWLVWQLTGTETRSGGFAGYKAQYEAGKGYPRDIVPGLAARLIEPIPVGTAAGSLSETWRRKCGIRGPAVVATTVIDSHAVMPAVGAVTPGSLVAAVGTSAVYLLLDDQKRPLPEGIEGMAFDGVIPGLWCYEAGQAGFGDTLAWFIRNFSGTDDLAAGFAKFNTAAAAMAAGESRLIALDWWNGCRVPYGDSALSGLIVGLTHRTTPVQIYRALLESLAYGARSIIDSLSKGNAPIDRIIVTSGLSQNNMLLMQVIADVLGRTILVPSLPNATAIGAAIHGAVASGVVASYLEGFQRFGAKSQVEFVPDGEATSIYTEFYRRYLALSENASLQEAMRFIRASEN